ncbi:Indoleamine 2,3-dioxygenase [Agrocybe pediades]|nr:Indoleamine 2,3-dioxygenase [Agrocybe pediades]
MQPTATTPAFDVDQLTGFMAPRPPISRLPAPWEAWEAALDSAVEGKIQLGDKLGLTSDEKAQSLRWRNNICQMPIIPTEGLSGNAILLRRAHVVLTYTMHFYVQSMPPDEAIIIPKSIGIPLLKVSKELDIPPILTFADTALYNWDFKPEVQQTEDTIPTPETIRTQTMFTNTKDEEEFYLCSARIELRGVEVLQLMQVTMDETFVGDALAVRRITGYLQKIARVINELKALLLDVKRLCNPDIYYNEVRPWFRGEDSSPNGNKKWIFEAIENYPDLQPPTELSGPSAGQSSMIHVLDIFLGVDHQATSPGQLSFMDRMKSYMPRNHRLFLNHLKANPRPLRSFVTDANDAELQSAYNHAVTSLKEFRDSHLIIATLYIVGPARRAQKLATAYAASNGGAAPAEEKAPLKGTGGTDLVKFLKDTRTRTTETLIQ